MAGRAKTSPRRLGRGEAIALVAAVILFALMFVAWYGEEVPGAAEGVPFGGGSQSAWEALDVIPLFLMLAIATTLGAVILRLSRSEWRPLIPPSAWVTLAGGLAALLILIRIVFPPDLGDFGGIELEATVRIGAFAALAAAIGIAYGGRRAMREAGESWKGIASRLESAR